MLQGGTGRLLFHCIFHMLQGGTGRLLFHCIFHMLQGGTGRDPGGETGDDDGSTTGRNRVQPLTCTGKSGNIVKWF